MCETKAVCVGQLSGSENMILNAASELKTLLRHRVGVTRITHPLSPLPLGNRRPPPTAAPNRSRSHPEEDSMADMNQLLLVDGQLQVKRIGTTIQDWSSSQSKRISRFMFSISPWSFLIISGIFIGWWLGELSLRPNKRWAQMVC